MTQDLYYYESGYLTPDTGYYTYVADAEETSSSEFTMTAVVGVIKNTTISLSSQFSQSSIISHIEGADLFAFNEASLAVTAQVIRDNNISLTSVFNCATDGKRIRLFSADEFVTVDFVGISTRIVQMQAATNAAFSLTANATKNVTVEASGTWSNTATVYCKISVKHNSSIDSGYTNATFSLTCAFTILHNFDVYMPVSTFVACQDYRIVQFASAEYAAFAPSFVCNAITNTFAVLDSTATVNATANRLRNIDAGLSSSTSLSAVGERYQVGNAALNSAFTQSTTIKRNRFGSAALSSQFTQATDGIVSNRRPRILTAFGTQSFPTTFANDKVVGTHALYFSTTSSYARTENSYEFNFGGYQDFVIEFFFRPTGSTHNLIEAYDASSSTNPVWAISKNSTTTRINFLYYDGSSLSRSIVGGTYTSGEWNYVKVSRSSSVLTITQSTYSGSGWSTPTDTGTGNAFIRSVTAPQLFINGRSTHQPTSFDELYIASNISTGQQFVGTSTPIVNNMGKDDNTLALYHFDNNYTDTMTGTAYAQAALQSTATVSAQAISVKSATSNLSALADVTSSISKTCEFTANLQVTGIELVVVGRIRPQVADLTTSSTLSATVDKIRPTTADLTSAFTLSATALDLDLATINLSSAFTTSASAKIIKNCPAALTSTSSIACNPDQVYLTMYYGAGNTSGYISSTGSTVRNTFSARDTAIDYGWDPVILNFWIKLEQDLGSNTSVILYQSGARTIELVRAPIGSGGTYYIKLSWTRTYSINVSSTDPNAWTRYTITPYYIMPITAGTDMTQWHCVQMPLDAGLHRSGNVWSTSGPLGGETVLYMVSPQFFFDGSEVTASLTTPTPGTGTSGLGYLPVVEPAPEGGQWGANTNLKTINLDEIWIKSRNYVSANTYETLPPTSDFYTNGNQAFITKQGLTTSGKQAQVYLPFRNLLDSATTSSPDWNYVKNGQVTYGFIEYGEAYLNTAFTQTTTATRARFAQAALTANASMSATLLRVRISAVTVNATATQSTTAVKTTNISLALQSTSTITANNRRTRALASDLQTTAIQTAQATKATVTQVTMNSSSTVVANNVRTRALTSNLSTNATITVNATKIARSGSAFEAFVTELAAVVKVGQGFIHFDSTAQVTAAVRVIRDQPINLASTTTVTATGYNTQFGSAALTSQSTVTAVVDKIKRVEVAATSQFTQTTNLTATRRTGKALQATATVTAINRRIRSTTTTIQSNATLTVQNQIVKLGQANLTTRAAVLCSPWKLLIAQAYLQCRGFEMVAGRIVHIDTYYQIRIKPETRGLRIHEESRLLAIDSETRVNKIIGRKR